MVFLEHGGDGSASPLLLPDSLTRLLENRTDTLGASHALQIILIKQLAYILEVSGCESATQFFSEKFCKLLNILLILIVSTMCRVKNALKWTSWQVSSEYPSEKQFLWNIPPENT